MKRCSKCKEEKELSAFGAHKGAADGLTAWCRQCRSEHRAPRSVRERAYNKAYLAMHPECSKNWQAIYPERRAAHIAIGNAVRDGRVFKQPCAVCGARKVEGHHPDYSKPLEVVWLCKAHHARCHALSPSVAPIAPALFEDAAA